MTDIVLPNGRPGYFLPIWRRDFDGTAVEISSGSVRHTRNDFAGIQFAAADGDCAISRVRGANVGQDITISAEVLVPKAEDSLTIAGPYFRSRSAAPADGLIGGASAGYWLQLDSEGALTVLRLNPHEVIARSPRVETFDSLAFHRIEAAVRGAEAEVAVDGRRIVFDQAGKRTPLVALSPLWEGPPAIGSNDGSAGIAFTATPRFRTGGQESRNIVVSAWRPLTESPRRR